MALRPSEVYTSVVATFKDKPITLYNVIVGLRRNFFRGESVVTYEFDNPSNAFERIASRWMAGDVAVNGTRVCTWKKTAQSQRYVLYATVTKRLSIGDFLAGLGATSVECNVD